MLVEITGNKDREQLTTTSRIVAEVFEKRHDHVIRDIEILQKDLPNFGEMYILTSYKDSYAS